MKHTQLHFTALSFAAVIIASLLLSPKAHAVKGSEYYQDGYLPEFWPYPTDVGKQGSRPWRLRYFGPVGIGIDLKRPGMTMEIWNVEAGSPAEKTGKLKTGQIIESINGVVLEKEDPRIILGDIITEAEATDGVIDLKIKGEGNVRVKIPVMGAYSPTWPVDCAKSDKIVRNLADLLAKLEKPSWGSVLFLLSTGEDRDLDVVRRWMGDLDTVGGITWEVGYLGIGVCEYYLRTGDESVLPAIQKAAEDLKGRMFNGGWSGRDQPASFTYSTGTGHVHASGMYAMNFLLMALLCGVEVDENLLNETLTQFYRFGGRGNVPYGNETVEGGFRDNGKTSGLAVTMATAALLTPDGENSVYAKARDNSAMKAFYATNWFHQGHTGGGMGEIWHHAAVSLVREKRPTAYRSYLDSRRWVMDTSRRHDGSIAIEGKDDQYNRSLTDATAGRDWGTFFALTYTYPRKQLQLWGAPRSPYAHHYRLPKRPWGNANDDIFNSPDPIDFGETHTLTEEELLAETASRNASIPVFQVLNHPDLTEEQVFKFILHPEYGYRVGAMRSVTMQGWSHLVVPLMKSDDPRLRELGLMAITGMFKGRALPNDQWTPEMFDLVGAMVEDPEESWWVAINAVKALGRSDPQRIARHRERLMALLAHESEWMRKHAVLTLCSIAGEAEHYETVLPAILATSASFTIDSTAWATANEIRKVIERASPEVKAFAKPYVEKVYKSIPEQLIEPHTGAVITHGSRTVRSYIGTILMKLPEGEELIRRIPKTTVESHRTGLESDKYRYNGKFEPNDQLIGTWTWAVHPSAERPEEIDDRILKWLMPRLKDGKAEIRGHKDTIVIQPEGKLWRSRFYPNYFWSGNWIIGTEEDQALKMDVRTHEGIDFLIIERSGKFGGGPDDEGTTEIPPDWHPGFHIYMRIE
jgi:hypothetical protein